jgi:hypothetical protein
MEVANANSSQAICIVGMHRSGTSMIAKLLHQCGLYLGPESRLLNATSANADGHFEHRGFLDINRALLRHFNATWQSPPELAAGVIDDPALAQLRARAAEVIAELSSRSPWGWKEPRTTVLLPFWRSLVPEVRFVVCIRSPLEVAKSLEKRNRIPLDQGISLWHRYTRSALEDSEGSPRIIVHYEGLFIERRREIEKLARFCGLRVPERVFLGEDGVRPELRHHRSEIAELLRVSSVPAEQKLFYLALRAIGNEEHAPDGAGERRGEAGELLRLLAELHDDNRTAQLERQLERTRGDLARARGELQRLASRGWAERLFGKLVKSFRA